MSELEEILKSDQPLPCPACEHTLRLPDDFSASSAVDCPKCERSITGQEIIGALKTNVEITVNEEADATLDDGSSTLAESSVQKTAVQMFDEQDFVIPKPLKTATQKRQPRTKRKKRDLTEKKVFGKQRKRKRRSSRSRRQQPTSTTEMIKIAFGAILALPLAQLILWWGFQADPLQLAKPTSEVFAFVVPPKMRALPKTEPVNEMEPKNKDLPPTQKLKDFKIPKSIRK